MKDIIKTFDVIRRLLVIMTRQQKIFGIVILFTSLIAAVLELLGVSIIVPLVNVLMQPQEILENPIIGRLAVKIGISTDEQITIFIIGCVILLYIVKNVYFVLWIWLRAKYAYKVQRECAVFMMQSYLQRGYAYFLNNNINELRQGVEVDVSRLYQIITGLIQFLTQVIIIGFICLYMCNVDWIMAISIILSALVCLIFIVLIFKKKMLVSGINYRAYNVKSLKYLTDAFYGIKDVLIMRKQHYFVKGFESYTIKKQKEQTLQAVGTETPNYIIEGLCVSGLMLVLGIRLLSLPNPQSFIAVLAAFAVGAFRILPALGKISISINQIITAIPNLNVVYENIIEARRNTTLFNKIEVEDEVVFKKEVDSIDIFVKDLSFAYNDKQGMVLKDLCLTIPQGSSVALVGESGAGKSTLADILLGVLEPSRGGIYINNINVKEMPNAWSNLIGFVPQSIYLSDTTIKENIAFGVSANEIDEDLVCKAVEDAHLLDFIKELPDGVNTVVGDRGVRLSGGQRQRIGIARALYRNPEILVLDEATSALDNDTEKIVMEAIDSLHGRMTLIIIAHRLTTIKNCDKIYQIIDGKAVEKEYQELT